MDGFITNIERDTLVNTDYRQVLFTGKNLQLVVMSLEPGEETGQETHEGHDQFIRIESGSGAIVLNGTSHTLGDGNAVIIPAGTYEGQAADVETAAVGNFLITSSAVSDETAYQMTKLLFENLPQLVAAHAAAKAIDPKKALDGMPVPLHPGAERYYKEVGLLK